MTAVFGEHYAEYRTFLEKSLAYSLRLSRPGDPYFIWGGIGEEANKLLSYDRGMPFIILPGFYFLSRKDHEYIRGLISYRLMIQVQLTDPKNAF